MTQKKRKKLRRPPGGGVFWQEQPGVLLRALCGIALLLFLAPFLFRALALQPVLFSENARWHLALARHADEPSLLFENRMVFRTPYHFLLALLMSVLPPTIALLLLSIFFGMGMLILFFLLLRKLEIAPFRCAVVCFLLLLTPGFLATVSIPSPLSMITILLLLLVLLVLSETMTRSFLLFPALFAVLSLLFLFGAGIGEIGMGLLALAAVARAKARKARIRAAAAWGCGILASIVLSTAAGLPRWYFALEPQDTLIQRFFADVGGLTGMSVFFVLLAGIGFFATWKKKQAQMVLSAAIALLFLLSLLHQHPVWNVLLLFPLAFLAACGLATVRNSDWKIPLLRRLTALLLALGLLFSTLSFFHRIPDLPPNQDLLEGMRFLAAQETGLVLAPPSLGVFIEEDAQQPVFLDAAFATFPDGEQRLLNYHHFLFSAKQEDTRALLRQEGIRWIMLDTATEQARGTEGLRRLLAMDNTTFKNIYRGKEVALWHVQP